MMLSQFLASCSMKSQNFSAFSGAEARRTMLEAEFDIIIINTPLSDEFGHELAQMAAHDTLSGVILIAKAEVSDAVAEKVEEDGVFVVSKPLNKNIFLQALRMIRATHSRLYGLQKENQKLQKKIEDIKLVDRAKCILIECCSMTEPEAHEYIEKQAMNKRLPKRQIAKDILHTNEI